MKKKVNVSQKEKPLQTWELRQNWVDFPLNIVLQNNHVYIYPD